MFFNLVNTDIPFAEYQLTQDQIDALKYRLLWSEGYLHAYELQEHSDPFERYMIYLLNIEGKLMFLLVSNGEDTECPLLRMVDVSESKPRQLNDEELLSFISKSYNHHPDKPLISNLSFSKSEMQMIIERLQEKIVWFVIYHRQTAEYPTKDVPLHHYDLYYDSSVRDRYIDELSPSETAEINRLMHIVLKKIYNYDEPFAENCK